MTARIILAIAALCLCAPLAHAAQEPPWEAFPPPPGATAQVVADEMVFNGIPMSVRAFESKRTVDEIVAFYQRRWKRRNRPDPVVNEMGPWTVVGVREGDYYLTVQAKEARNGSMGFMGVSRMFERRKKVVLGEGTPMPPGSVVVNDIIHNDPGKSARTVALSNDHSMTDNAVFYLGEYVRLGWTLFSRKDTPHPGTLLVFRKDRMEANVMITQKFDKTFVFINTTSLEN